MARAFQMNRAPSALLPHNATKQKFLQDDCIDYNGQKHHFPYSTVVGSILYARISRSDV